MSLVPGPVVIVALDYHDRDQAIKLAKTLDPKFCHLKVGPVLFLRYGPALIEELMQLGYKIFLDLKLHDIPNTVASAVRAAQDLQVWMLSLHLSGGEKMLQAAVNSISGGAHKPLLVGVSVLTSMLQDDLNEIGVNDSVETQVTRLINLALTCHLDGVVCSGLEVAALKREYGTKLIYVTPGIRADDEAGDDQARTTSASTAYENGADYLVIGRPITQSADPVKALEQINGDIKYCCWD